MNYNGCGQTTTNKIITVTENKMRFTIKNDLMVKIIKVKVDGCLIKGHQQRCDYLFEIDNPAKLILYVELKGRDVEKAVKQLYETIRFCANNHNKVARHCHIVASRVPKAGPKTQIIKKQFADKCGIQLFVHTNRAEVCV